MSENMKEQILSTGKILISDIAQAIKNEIQPLDEKSQQRLDQITELDQAKIDQKAIEPNELGKAKPARFQLKDIILPATTENEIREALIKVKFHELIYHSWGFNEIDPSGKGCVLNFYGSPGTGKSRGAEALAGELGLPFLKVDLAELESKFMGETAKNLCAVFKEAQENHALLFFDEADTVLGKRLSSVTQGVDAFRGSMKVAIQEMQESVQSASQGLHDTVESMKKEVSTTFTEFRDNVSQTLAKVGDDISTSSLAIKSSVDTLSESMSRELQNVTMVTASLTTHSREMAVAITEQKLTLEEMGDKVQSIAAKGAEYAFSLDDVTSNIGKLAGSDGIIASSLEKVAKNTHESNQYLEVLANNVTIAEKNTLSNSVAEI